MAAFATPEDLASYLQVGSVDRYSAELLLDLASGAVRDEVHQQIDQASSVEIYDGLPGDHPWAHVIFLRQVPVTAVASVVSDGTTVDPGSYEWSSDGAIVHATGVWSSALGGIQVTYTHGWSPGDPALATARSVTLQIAARAYTNPGQVDSLTVGGISRTYSRDSPRPGRVEMSEHERRRLDPLRR